ncbi:MAG: hypothetical protein NTX82_05750 [Candidatus Parcubacteria bacterium]|nr:hypothetical protein [Candidatus Parcubacteria bacterium]
MLKIKKILPSLVILASFLVAKTTFAVCPVCAVAVGVGLGFSRWLGVDDLITGTWIGGLLVTISWWTVEWLDSKKIKFKGRKILITLAYYLLTIVPLYLMGIMGHPYNQFWGIDKLLFGIIVGSVAFFFGSMLNLWLKKKNGGKVYIKFQRVIIPVVILLIISLVWYLILKI